jgi:hypothetical protein
MRPGLLTTMAACVCLATSLAGTPAVGGGAAQPSRRPASKTASAASLAWLGTAETVALGVELYRTTDRSLLSPAGVVAVQLLRIDRRRVDLQLVLAQDTVLGTETVPEMARRTKALAAINAGFFLPTGEPAGLMKLHGEFVSEIGSRRGALGFAESGRRMFFDQVSAGITIEIARGKQRQAVPLSAVDTVRGADSIVLFTPRFSHDTNTPCDGGTEWILEGSPLRVTERRDRLCRSAIPSNGAVISAGPGAVERLSTLSVGDRVDLDIDYKAVNGTRPSDWNRLPDIIGGVGLLVVNGQPVTDWAPEKARDGFATERHPRTMVGIAADGDLWMITVDGRNPAVSIGMTFKELQGLAARLGLVDALNLDGGGSTTMVVNGAVINHPSDATGPRKVSDAILVFRRGQGGS